MIRKYKRNLLFSVLMLSLVWFSWPVYMFFAHKGDVPMPPYGLLKIPAEAPAFQTLPTGGYQEAGEKALASITEHRRRINVPGISAAVAIDGKLVWAGVAGWADIASATPVTIDTQFRIGSTSKSLTATGLARLVQTGVIDLDTPISKYLDKLPREEWANITPRQLASHMAGLPEYAENRDWFGLHHTMVLQRHYDNAFDALKVFDDSPLLYKPGTRFHYSSFSTVLLSAVMAAAANQSYVSLMQENVFSPLDMRATGPEPENASPAMATFYWRSGEKVKPWRNVDLSHRLAGGGFIATPSDLVKLGSAWLNSDFIHPQTRKLFWEPQRLNNGDLNEQHYALGWRIHESDDYMDRNANHGGVSRGSQAWLMVIPERHMSVAVMINARTEAFWDFGEIAIVLADYFEWGDLPSHSGQGGL